MLPVAVPVWFLRVPEVCIDPTGRKIPTDSVWCRNHSAMNWS